MFVFCCHIKHVDAWGCAIIPNKADNNPKAEPNRLRRSGCLLVSSGSPRLWGQPPLSSIFDMPKLLTIRWLTTRSMCHHWCHLPLRNTHGKEDRLKCLLWFLYGPEKKGPGKPNHWVSISQGLKTTGHANSSPQTVNNAHSSIPPPHAHLSRSVAKLTGTCPSVPL